MAQTELEACKRVVDAQERLGCYDRALGFEAGTVAQPLRDADIQAEFHKRRKSGSAAAEQVLFVRSSTTISADNGDPAEVALGRSAGRTTGTAKAAILWVPYGKLGVLDTEEVKGMKPYLALGFESDSTQMARVDQVATQTFRLGGRSVLKARQKLQTGGALAYELALRLQNNDVTDTRTASIEVPVDMNYHWLVANEALRIRLRDRWVFGSLAPYVDHSSRRAPGQPASVHGLDVRLGLAALVPELPESMQVLNRLRPHLLQWQSEHVRQFNGAQPRSTKHSLSTSWVIHRSHNGQQGIKLERVVGRNFRDGEEADVARTAVKLTAKY
ncbi:hypothetical protein [Aquabacterium sp. OR-4]|uniref:hypothetical protein n=1 Tax=Aquabacterium sp. OR-4 TaxID=2978127 RepID=UPI0028C577CA|nr:hypothetical protein [Aquabacterium sp. OR-4]MDT7835198.1 hypothetical protein [Aquabacterium sp. OR-4]